MPSLPRIPAASRLDHRLFELSGGHARAVAVFARLGNVFAADVRSGASTLDLDVSRCRFVELCVAVGRPELASLFCAADAQFFDHAEAPVRLTRTGTFATGAHRCDFRFTLREPPESPPAGAP